MSNIKQLIDGVVWSAVKTGESIGRQAAAHEKRARADYAAGRFGEIQRVSEYDSRGRITEMTKRPAVPDWEKYLQAQDEKMQRAAAEGAEKIALDKYLISFHESARPAIKELLQHIFREKAEFASAHFCDKFMGRGGR